VTVAPLEDATPEASARKNRMEESITWKTERQRRWVLISHFEGWGSVASGFVGETEGV
jgi:hypothetical protein